MSNKELRRNVINLASKLAQQEQDRTGENYSKCIGQALDEACTRLSISRKMFIKMFI